MKSVRQFVAVSLLGIFSLTAYADLEVGLAAPELDTVLIDGSVLTARQNAGKVVARFLSWLSRTRRSCVAQSFSALNIDCKKDGKSSVYVTWSVTQRSQPSIEGDTNEDEFVKR
jgi:hypothetical protein